MILLVLVNQYAMGLDDGFPKKIMWVTLLRKVNIAIVSDMVILTHTLPGKCYHYLIAATRLSGGPQKPPS